MNTPTSTLKKLHSAVKEGDIKKVAQCVADGADPNQTASGSTPLHMAVFHGHAHIVLELIDAGANHTLIDDCHASTPLHIAATEGDTLIVEILLTANADPNAKDEAGNTPLHLAANYDHPKTVRELLIAGANPKQKNKRRQRPQDMVHRNSPHKREIIDLLTSNAKHYWQEGEFALQTC